MTRRENPGRPTHTLGKRIVLYTMTALVCFGTGGCFDREELEQQAFVTSLGIDSAPGGLVDCTFQIAVPKAASGGSGGGGGGSEPLAGKGPITVRSKTVMDALALGNVGVERTLTLTHLNSVIIGESLAKEGLLPTIRPMMRYREFRRTMYVKIAKGNAREVMANDKPMLETTNTRVPDGVQFVGKKTGMAPVSSRLQDLAIAMESPHEAAVLPVYALNQSVKADPKGEEGIHGDLTYKPGEIARNGGNPVEYVGGAVLDGDKLVGFLDGQQVMALRFLRGSMNRARMDVPDPTDKTKFISLSVRRERRPNYQIQLGQPVKISITIPLDADLIGIGSGSNLTLPGPQVRLETTVDEHIQSMTSSLIEEWAKKGIDIVPISTHIRGKFLTDAQFVKYPWQSRLKDADIKVRVQVHIRRFGLQTAPMNSGV